MIIDIEKYSANRKYIQDAYLTKYNGQVAHAMGQLASITFVPVLAVAYYIGEVAGWEAVEPSIRRIVDFYGYTVIENKPEGAP